MERHQLPYLSINNICSTMIHIPDSQSTCSIHVVYADILPISLCTLHQTLFLHKSSPIVQGYYY